MKAISEIIAVVLVVMIAVSTIALLWISFNTIFKTIAAKGQPTSSRLGDVLSSCMKIDSVQGNKIYLRNCGSGIITNDTLKVFLDDGSFNFTMTPASIGKSEVATITLFGLWGLSGNIKIRITNPAGQVERYVKAGLPSSTVLALDFDEGEGNIAYDSSGYGNNGDIHAVIRNLVSNPSFENGKQGWGSGSGNWTIVSDVKYHGGYSSRFQDLIGDSNDEEAGTVYIPVTTGQSITVSAYSKGQNIQIGSQPWHYALLIGIWVDSHYQDLGYSHDDVRLGDGTGTWDWKRTYDDFQVPPNAAYYSFDMGLQGSSRGTLWVDAVQVENGNTLTPFRTMPWVSGKSGYAIEFNGIDDYVNVSRSNSLNITGNEITVECWSKFNKVNSEQDLITKSYGSRAYYLWLDDFIPGIEWDMRFMAYNNTQSAMDVADSTTVLQIGKWYHFLGIINKTHIKIYVNGIEKNASRWYGNIHQFDAGAFNIGYYSYYLNGTIDNVRVYNKALTPDETVVLTLGEFT
jgi:archaellum component FlaG (FlaF/FlaG flagellin family)